VPNATETGGQEAAAAAQAPIAPELTSAPALAADGLLGDPARGQLALAAAAVADKHVRPQ
jgi:hypothetical protein